MGGLVWHNRNIQKIILSKQFKFTLFVLLHVSKAQLTVRL